MDNKALMQEKESEYQCKVLSKNFKLMLTNQNDTTMKKKMSLFLVHIDFNQIKIFQIA